MSRPVWVYQLMEGGNYYLFSESFAPVWRKFACFYFGSFIFFAFLENDTTCFGDDWM